MDKIYIKARAKINLTLNVLNKREDGYHNLESIFQKISLYDELYIVKTDKQEINIKSNIEELQKDNIIIMAYEKLKGMYKNITGVDVKLIKNIPMQAGLGGGSADCASFIIAMNKMFDLKMSENDMIDLAKNLGADVAPCMYNKALKADGIGEKIILINTNFKYYMLVIKPNFFCNTKTMFEKFDNMPNLIQRENTDFVQKALETNNIYLLSHKLYNVFEWVVSEREAIKNIKKQLLKNGAIGAAMTGAGSCVYGIFDNKKLIKRAYKNLKEKYNIFLCTSYNYGGNFIEK